jgi:hypothetical protein
MCYIVQVNTLQTILQNILCNICLKCVYAVYSVRYIRVYKTSSWHLPIVRHIRQSYVRCYSLSSQLVISMMLPECYMLCFNRLYGCLCS